MVHGTWRAMVTKFYALQDKGLQIQAVRSHNQG
jgi:hypothetical protein